MTTLAAPPSQGLYEWTARIECKKYELDCSYTVIIFLGQVPADPDDWQISPNYVGSHSAFVNRGDRERNKRRGGSDVVIEGFVHLNQAILKHSGLQSLEPSVVVPYLTRALQWRVQKDDLEPAKLESLEVTVHTTTLTFPPGSTFPVPGTSRCYDSITYGREGGSRHPPA